jgi:hypothetical protein
VNTGGWFKRQYVNTAHDALEANGSIFILKSTGLYMLDSTTMTDDNKAMLWSFQTKTLVSNNDFLIKRVRVDTTPMHVNYADEVFRIGNVILKTAQPESAYCIYHNFAQIYHNIQPIKLKKTASLYTNSDEVYDDWDYIYGNPTYLKSLDMCRAETRCVDRHKGIKVFGRGGGGVTVFNRISFDVVEV